MTESLRDNKPCRTVIWYFKINIAQKNIEVECINQRVFHLCHEYLSEFEHPDFVISITEKELEQEYLKSNQRLTDYDGTELDLSEYYEVNLVYKKIADCLISDGIIMLHGAAVAVDNKCYIFTAASGTGKSTHVQNWLKKIEGSFIVNGDKPLVDVHRKLVHGTPWCGKEQMNTNTSVPLVAIIALERGEDNIIVPIHFKEMLPTYIQQSYIPDNPELAMQVYPLIGELKEVPCYRLSCNMDAESALVAYQELRKNENLP